MKPSEPKPKLKGSDRNKYTKEGNPPQKNTSGQRRQKRWEAKYKITE